MPLTQKKALKDFHDFELNSSDFLVAVLEGLSAPQKVLPSKFFYDKVGSRIFDDICDLDEYYPTRSELEIFETYKHEIADQIGERVHLVEFGSGSSIKVRTLMEALKSPLGYLPIDISREHLIQSAEGFSKCFPHIALTAICADYTSEFDLPLLSKGRYVGFYPGSTIGNFTPIEAVKFLRNTKKTLGHCGFLIGVDLVKDHQILNAAYDDALGVTAAFNKNILARCNRELGTLFNLNAFNHSAFFNPLENRIEMHLVSAINQTIQVREHTFHFKKDETIHTENSYKYTLDGFADLAKSAGFKPIQSWTDPNKYFSVNYLLAD
jgi:dimethylhistidine N-methyltransferase